MFRNLIPILHCFEFVLFCQGEDTPRFVSIGAMYSELIAVGQNGHIYQWKWSEPEPYKNPEVRTRHALQESRIMNILHTPLLSIFTLHHCCMKHHHRNPISLNFLLIITLNNSLPSQMPYTSQ